MKEATTILYWAVDSAMKKNKKTKVNFEDDPGTFRDPEIKDSDSETKLYEINIINLVDTGKY